MLLTIDIDTHSVIGIFDQGDLKRRWRISTDRRRSVDETYLLLDGCSSCFVFLQRCR